MTFYQQKEACKQMNAWGASGKDFLFVIDYKQEHCFLSLLEDVEAEEILYAFPSARNDKDLVVSPLSEIQWETYPEDPASYFRKFNIVQNHLHQGNSFLTNLTCCIPIDTNLCLKDIYLHSVAMYKLWLKDQFVCFSPEIFVRIHDGKIHSHPMKGTISANIPKAEVSLMSNAKEAAEHATIVDLIRNDLSIIAKDVYVDRYRYMDYLQTNKGKIIQTSSDIVGTLEGDYLSRIGDILFSLLPAGSITGAPKKKTLDIIAEAEGYDRGFYTGVMGICKDGNVESAVMIRFIEKDENGQLYFKAGGGITAQSDWDDEYNEVIQKAYVPIY